MKRYAWLISTNLLLISCGGKDGGGGKPPVVVDSAAPTFLANPTATAVTTNSAELAVALNEDGEVFYRVLPATAPGLTLVDLKASQTKFALKANEKGKVIRITDLQAGVEYVAYLIAKDTAGNFQAAPVNVKFKTEALAAPTFVGGITLSNLEPTTATATLKLSTAGTVKYSVRLATEAAPNAADLQAATTEVQTAADGNATIQLSQLAADSNYVLYVLAKNAQGTYQTNVTAKEFKTAVVPDTTAPTFVQAVAVDQITETTATVKFKLSEKGVAKYLVALANAAEPTVQALKNSAQEVATANDGAATINLQGLTGPAAYKIYVLAKDTAGNYQAAVSSTPFSTVDQTAPTFVQAVTVGPIAETAATVKFKLSEKGAAKYLVALASAAAPSVQDLKASTLEVATVDDGTATIDLQGLTGPADYKIYVLAKDTAGNYQTAVSSTAFSTLDQTAPTFLQAVAVGTIAETTATVNFKLSEKGGAKYLVTSASAATPSVQDLKASTLEVATVDDGTATINLQGLTGPADYKIHVLAKDTAGNYQAAVSSTAFSTIDQTAPSIVDAVAFSSVTETTATAKLKLSEKGSVKYAVRLLPEAAPTVDELKTSTSEATTAADNTVTFDLKDLTAATSYRVFMLAQDTAGNFQSTVVSETLTTIDQTAPTFAEALSVTDITETTATAKFKLSEKGSAKYIVALENQADPTVEDLKNSTKEVETANDGSASIELKDLTTRTAYKVHVLAKDVFGNVQKTVTSVRFEVIDVTPPTLAEAITFSAVTETTATAKLKLSEKGSVQYLVKLLPEAEPTVAELKASTNEVSTAADNTVTFDLKDLTASTPYRVFVLAKDTSGNYQAAAASSTLTTVDLTAPTLSEALTVNSITETTATVHFKLSEKGAAKYLVALASAAAPTVEALKESTQEVATVDDGTATINLQGLTGPADYKIYVLAKDTSGNYQSTFVSADFSTIDQTAPSIVENVAFSSVTETTATAKLKLSEKGSVKYAVRLLPEAAPTVDELKASTSEATTAADNTVTFDLKDLAAATSYRVFVLAQDTVGNYQSLVVSSTLTTLDLTAPTLADLAVSDIAETTASVTFKLNEKGTAKYLVALASAAEPGVQALKDSTQEVATANDGSATISLQGLTGPADYKVYVLAKDTSGNYQSSFASAAFSTIDQTAPSIVDAVAFSDIKETTATAKLKLSEKGSVKYLVRLLPEAIPTVDQLKASTNEATTAADNTVTFDLQDLAAATTYRVFLLAQDTAGNYQSTVVSATLTTVDLTAPSFAEALTASDLTETTANLNFRLSEQGTAKYIVTAADAPAPSKDALKNSANEVATATENRGIIKLKDLTQDTDYTVHVLAKDAAGNYQEAPTSVAFKTVKDVTPPAFTAAPAATPGNTEVSFSFALSESGSLKYIHTLASESAPSLETLKNATTEVAIAANGLATLSLSNLQQNTGYVLYVLAKDNAGNFQTAATAVTYSTTKAEPPMYLFPPSIAELNPDGGTFKFLLSRAGVIRYLVRESSEAAPSVADLIANGQKKVVTDPNSPEGRVIAFDGVQEDHAYKAYFIAGTSDELSFQTAFVSLQFSLTDPLKPYAWHLKNNGTNAFAYESGIAGNDINADGAIAQKITGRGVKVRVSDTGVQLQHPDLVANTSLAGSNNYYKNCFNCNSDGRDPSPYITFGVGGDHGTSVAGLIGAKGWNGIGSRGVAPNATLVGANFLGFSDRGYNPTDDEITTAFYDQYTMGNFDVVNMSWGYTFADNLPSLKDTVADTIMQTAVTEGRNGKGIIFMKANGNSFDEGVNGSFDYEASRPWILTVAATNALGKRSSYSTPGSNLWISSIGGEFGWENKPETMWQQLITLFTDYSWLTLDTFKSIFSTSFQPAMVTTDIVNPAGTSTCEEGYARSFAAHDVSDINGFLETYAKKTWKTDNQSFNLGTNPLNANCGYTSQFNGTSAATPVATGVIALILEANPALTWRDVRYILAKTADKLDPNVAPQLVNVGGRNYVNEPGWTTNAAGFNFHNWYGFGRVNAGAAVAMAKTYNVNLGEMVDTDWQLVSDTRKAIPSQKAEGLTLEFESQSNLIVENVLIEVSAGPSFNGTRYTTPLTNLAIEVISPSGTRSVVMNLGNGIKPAEGGTVLDGHLHLIDQEFLSNAFYGEAANGGKWKIRFIDNDTGNGSVENVKIRFIGHAK